MILVGELNLRDGAGGRRRIDQDGIVALDEAVPLKVEGNTLRVSGHVPIRCLGVLGLRVDDLHELSHAMLDRLDYVRLELRERILNADEVLSVVVLLQNLLVQAVHDTTLQDIRVVRSLDVTAVRIE
jgi:hypothetical protein